MRPTTRSAAIRSASSAGPGAAPRRGTAGRANHRLRRCGGAGDSLGVAPQRGVDGGGELAPRGGLVHAATGGGGNNGTARGDNGVESDQVGGGCPAIGS